ncbi:hypothetical protein Poli38472_002646 [Pythium oligandrum]|uniref:PX domain-containing protein n=1 Tax=Pythium oligandrum TaxID=41045 RepID=A0A8K1FHA8_PYTOL|nr:hypothetical protein Poli38472_002646 [Pythium oligandrum]|eukprot:TMW63705.1 hypothetical protein Poli38472_002646 [Pythium oligandrum]
MSARSSRLQPLTPTSIFPELQSPQLDARLALQRIAHVEIHDSIKHNSKRYYVINIYFQLSQSHIPTNCVYTGRKPDLQVDRSFSEFIHLRNSIYDCANPRHNNYCGYCSRAVDFVLMGPSQPRTITKVLSSDKWIRHTLEVFITEVLKLALGAKLPRGAQCPAQETLPLLVKEFLAADVLEVERASEDVWSI